MVKQLAKGLGVAGASFAVSSIPFLFFNKKLTCASWLQILAAAFALASATRAYFGVSQQIAAIRAHVFMHQRTIDTVTTGPAGDVFLPARTTRLHENAEKIDNGEVVASAIFLLLSFLSQLSSIYLGES